ncbi:DUF3572 domain-containing protein [Paracoccus nototheniae]|uniref:DUF3572 family protein n=1 Tax=Paracoccus nototheniae TaxID=2489002 RepID=A0ABW4DW45_9RHOB|nr:DUF3572 family protein [Paracoccus nototheniae]
MAMSNAQAGELAMQVLIVLVDRPDDLALFMQASGLRPADLRAVAEQPDIALHLLDFIVEQDERITSFAQALNLRPQDIMAARTALAGPGSYGWDVE